MATPSGRFQKVGQEKLNDADAAARSTTDKQAAGGADQGWGDIQRRAFTNWFNYHLRAYYKKHDIADGGTVADLNESLGNGLLLILLLQQLSKKKFPRYNKKPRIKQQELENHLQALRFMEKEDIKLVNIGKRDSISLCSTPSLHSVIRSSEFQSNTGCHCM